MTHSFLAALTIAISTLNSSSAADQNPWEITYDREVKTPESCAHLVQSFKARLSSFQKAQGLNERSFWVGFRYHPKSCSEVEYAGQICASPRCTIFAASVDEQWGFRHVQSAKAQGDRRLEICADHAKESDANPRTLSHEIRKSGSRKPSCRVHSVEIYPVNGN